jgi:hypothetical protein
VVTTASKVVTALNLKEKLEYEEEHPFNLNGVTTFSVFVTSVTSQEVPSGDRNSLVIFVAYRSFFAVVTSVTTLRRDKGPGD